MFDLIILVGLIVAAVAAIIFIVRYVMSNIRLGKKLMRLEEQDDLPDNGL